MIGIGESLDVDPVSNIKTIRLAKIQAIARCGLSVLHESHNGIIDSLRNTFRVGELRQVCASCLNARPGILSEKI